MTNATDTRLPASLSLRLRRVLLRTIAAVLDTKALASKLGHVIPEYLLTLVIVTVGADNAHDTASIARSLALAVSD